MSNFSHMEGHTYQRFDGELNNLHLKLLEMGGLVFDQFRVALDAIKRADLGRAKLVRERRQQVEMLEKQIDSDITATMAKRGPLARDLRGLMAFSKAVADLARIGNEAVRMAEVARTMYGKGGSTPNPYLMRDINAMGKLVGDHLSDALVIFDRLDAEQAINLLRGHNDLNEEFKADLRRLTTFVMEDSRNVGHVINIVLVLKSLERIGDHAYNLAEYIIFLVCGEDIRHLAV